jgi:hypothetical protein
MTYSKSLSIRLCMPLLAIALSAGIGSVFAEGVQIRTVALDGDIAPGADPGSTFFAFNDLAVNDSGAVSFRGFLVPLGFDDCDEGLWSGLPGGLALVACEGFPAPDTEEGTTFLAPGNGFPGNSVINDLGEVGFTSRLSGTVEPFTGEGIWLGPPGNVRLVARDGDQAPGTPEGTRFIGLGSARLVLNNAGHSAFAATLMGPDIGPTNDRGIWLGSLPDNLVLITRKGEPAPDTDDGVVFSDFDFNRAVNDNGEVAIRAVLEGPDVDFTNGSGVWIGGPHNLRLAVRAGDPVPGLPLGSYYELIGFPTLNNAGEIVFSSSVTGYPNTWWLWAGEPGGFELAARQGEQAPGTDPGVVFSDVIGDIVLNGNGEVAFRARLTGPGVTTTNGVGIWAGPPGGLELVVRDGDPVPGALSGQVIYNLVHSALYLNTAGDVAFHGLLTGLGPPGGVWMKPKAEELVAIAVTGDVIEVRPGDFRTVSGTALDGSSGYGAGNQDGRRSSLSDLGVVAFGASFDDGSRGIFIARAALPAPADLIAELIDTVRDLTLGRGTETSLVQKLSAALNRLQDTAPGNDRAAVNILNAFVAQVEALRDKKVAGADADMLTELAEQIIQELQTV